ncbi:hypothetical protein [Marimonas lutisalis]|uniref:hypothetical protein n=1 Tax=Marimonas lutisalis TaxID=2545756 RepID=UPI0010F84F83|nr:hypothetical protein [Marimonas lutisalis]
MYWRHEQIVRLSAWPTKVEARLYNLAKRALARFGDIRMEMRGLKTLDLIVQEDAWIIVDRALNDIPIAAWTDFEDEETRGLHEPVICELRYYHGHAGLVIKKVLRRMEEGLGEMLDDGEEPGQVIAFPGPRDDG